MTSITDLFSGPPSGGRLGRRAILVTTLTALLGTTVGILPAAADDYAPAGDAYAMARVAQRIGAEKFWNDDPGGGAAPTEEAARDSAAAR